MDDLVRELVLCTIDSIEVNAIITALKKADGDTLTLEEVRSICDRARARFEKAEKSNNG